jgi:hypothetical protein
MLLRRVVAVAALLLLAACGEDLRGPTATSAKTPTLTYTGTAIPMQTPTPAPTHTATPAPTKANTPTQTAPNTHTTTVTATPTATTSATVTATNSGTPAPTDTPPPPTSTRTATPTSTSTLVPGSVASGQLVGGSGAYPGGIGGVHFRSGTQSGFTDETGTFTYIVGEPVTFSLADVEFRPAAGAATISPWQLAASGQCAQGPELVRLLVLFYSLDADGDPSNGTAVPVVPEGGTARAFVALSDADVAALVDQLIPGRTPIAGDSAEDLFIRQMDGEVWQQIGIDQFPGQPGAVRSQGLTTDGSSWFFSWTLGLEKTDLDYKTEVSNITAIPPDLSRLGDKHIGDIDYWNDTLYVPLEDSRVWMYPHIALYDPNTLTAIQSFALPTALLTDGVPWVAVDGPRGVLYAAVWDPTVEIFVFDLATVTYSRSIVLRPALGRIQGGKVFEGALYLSTDSAAQDIFKVNLDTGTVIPLFALNQNFEEEGLAFLARPDGSLLHTLNVFSHGLGSELRHHQRTRLPLRQAVCR